MPTSRLLKSAAWLSLLAILFVTICPIDLRPHTMTEVGIDRAGAFAAMALLFTSAYPRQWLAIAVLLALSAFGLELLQELSPTRHARFDDALVKAAGALFGVAVAHALLRLGRLYAPSLRKNLMPESHPAPALDLSAAQNTP